MKPTAVRPIRLVGRKKERKEPQRSKIESQVNSINPFYSRTIISEPLSVFRLTCFTEDNFVSYSLWEIQPQKELRDESIQCSYGKRRTHIKESLAFARYRLEVLDKFLHTCISDSQRVRYESCFTSHISDWQRRRSVVYVEKTKAVLQYAVTFSDCNSFCRVVLSRIKLLEIADMFHSALEYFDSEMERLGIKVERLIDDNIQMFNL